MIRAVILASGKSERFGGVKLLERFRGRPLIEICLNSFLKTGVKGVVVTHNPAISDISTKMGFRTVPGGVSLSESLKSGLKSVDWSEGILIHLADIPFVRPETIKNLIDAFSSSPDKILIPRYNGAPGHPRIFPPELIPEFFSITGDRGGRDIVDRHSEKVRRFDCNDPGVIYDIDTREQLERAYSLFRI